MMNEEYNNQMIEKLQKKVVELQKDNDALRQQYLQLQAMYLETTSSFSWRFTAPVRKVLDYLKVTFRNTPLRTLYRAVKYLKRYGIRATLKQIVRRLERKAKAKRSSSYTMAELKKQREVIFPQNVRFSIVVPLYNTPESFLREMIQSVIDQTYSNWELCMADGIDIHHDNVGKICKEYANKDSRIRYKKLEKNLGISGNTNTCIDLATGDYIALFDHDDLLHPSALFETMCAICEKNADFIYTDENTFHKTPKDAYCPHFKPDFSPDTLRSYNYICHFTVFKKTLLDEIGGGFRSEYDGSQDYDLILRLTEKAKQVVHVPRILYYWRSHERSVASDISAKPYTMVAAKTALKEHMVRMGFEGDVYDAKVPSIYRIKYKLRNNGLVSILIPNKDHIDDLSKCIESIRNKSTYENWEIIVIENNTSSMAPRAWASCTCARA